MKYLRKFETNTEKSAWQFSDEYVVPNVVLVEGMVEYNKINPAEIPMYIEALEDLRVEFSNTYEYSKDNDTWDGGTSSTKISATAGERVYFRASGLTANSAKGIGLFTISNGTCNVGGNIMSMVYGGDYKGKVEITASYQFFRLFNGAKGIIDASKLILPATTLASSCYREMFYNCTSLINAPKFLPATTLASSCYDRMFYSCTSLVNAPVLPATTLASSCYAYMFCSCTSLVEAPALPATTLKSNCYESMFYSCTSLVEAPALPATTLANFCYREMFYSCTSLVNAPALPATYLSSYCYDSMFKGCSNLNYIKAMFKSTPSSSYTSNWLSGVAAEGTFVKNAAATWNVTGANGIPSGWIVETAEA